MKVILLRGFTASLVAMIGALVAVGTASDAPTIGICQNDEAANMIHCAFYNPNGIQSVFITLDTDDGLYVAVNETYDCESPVLVEWEKLGLTHHFEVVA